MDVSAFLVAWAGLWWWGARRRPMEFGRRVWTKLWVGWVAFWAAAILVASWQDKATGPGPALVGFALGVGCIWLPRRYGDHYRRQRIRAASTAPRSPPPPPEAVAIQSRKPSREVLEYVRERSLTVAPASRRAVARTVKPTSEPPRILSHANAADAKPARKRRRRQPEPQLEVTALHFAYEDAEGNQSIRVVTDWREEDQYVIGWCATAHDTRTFRKDRVLEWLDGTDDLLESPDG